MAQHDKETTRDVDDVPPVLLYLFEDRQIAVLRRGRDHAGQGWGLTEFDRVDVFERVEVDDHARLAFRYLSRQKTVPVARAWRALHVSSAASMQTGWWYCPIGGLL